MGVQLKTVVRISHHCGFAGISQTTTPGLSPVASCSAICKSPSCSTFSSTTRPVSANHLFSIPVRSDCIVKAASGPGCASRLRATSYLRRWRRASARSMSCWMRRRTSSLIASSLRKPMTVSRSVSNASRASCSKSREYKRRCLTSEIVDIYPLDA